MQRILLLLLMLCQPCQWVFAQTEKETKDTLFFQLVASKDLFNDQGIRTNLLRVKAQLYAPPRIFIKKDSLYRPTRVRVSFSFERTAEKETSLADTSQIAGEYALTVLRIYQLYVNKIRKEYWKTTLKKGQTLHLKEIMERNFQDMLETDLRFREETEYGTTPEKIKLWSVYIQKELDSMEKKQ